MKIKIFKDYNCSKLENKVNEFLTKNSLAENIKDIQITSSYDGKGVQYLCVVVV